MDATVTSVVDASASQVCAAFDSRQEPVDAASEHESLLGQLARGEAGAMEALMVRYGRLIWWMARRWNRHQADAEDAVQEIMIDVWKSASRYDRELGSESVYITMIARRRLLDRYRGVQSQRAHAGMELAASSTVRAAASPAERTEECDAVMNMLAKLGSDQDEVLRLAFAEGYTQKCIAKQLDLPMATVASRMHRGLQRLQHLLKEREGPKLSQVTM